MEDSLIISDKAMEVNMFVVLLCMPRLLIFLESVNETELLIHKGESNSNCHFGIKGPS